MSAPISRQVDTTAQWSNHTKRRMRTQKNTGLRGVVSLPRGLAARGHLWPSDDLFFLDLAFSASGMASHLSVLTGRLSIAMIPTFTFFPPQAPCQFFFLEVGRSDQCPKGVRPTPENWFAFSNQSRGACRGPPMPRLWRQVGVLADQAGGWAPRPPSVIRPLPLLV